MFIRKKKVKMYKYLTRSLTLTLEHGWAEYSNEVENNNDIPLTFYKEKDGIGALQISLATARHGEKFDINDVLTKGNISPSAKIKEYRLRDFVVYEYETIDQQRYYKYFNLVKLNVVVLVTYNCGLVNKNNKELNEAIKIAKSIKVISNN